MKMKSKYNKRQLKKLNKKAMKFLIARREFSEDDFSDDGQELYIHIQTESCDEYDEHSPFDWICHTAFIKSIDYVYDKKIDHVREKIMFKLRNVKHIFEVYQMK